MAVKNNGLKTCKKTVLRVGLLAEGAEVVREKMIPYQWDALNDQLPNVEPSYAIENLRIAAGEKSGEFRGMIFQDSDVAKWLEAVAYRLETHPDAAWEGKADAVIDLVERAQQPDGYLNSYYTIVEPDKRWTNLRDNHELYCAGHFIEAAVAYYEATGKDKLLNVMCKFVDHIASIFGPEPEKKKGYPGHEEIELALIKLYRLTGNKQHLELAKFFIEERGQQPHYFVEEAQARAEQGKYWWNDSHGYSQSHLPVRAQTTAEGHSVRAMYLYAAVADLAIETDDQELVEVCKTLWENTVNRRMYITGALGSQEFGEGFTTDYDLPSDTAYAETCAAIGLVFWAQRMLQIEPNRKYGDVLERALYNGVLSGMSLEGDRFFYVNPLEVSPKIAAVRHDHRHVKTTRQEWFGCACCPPNIARLLTSINQYIYSQSTEGLYVHLYADSKVEFALGQTKVNLSQETEYPWDGRVRLNLAMNQSANFGLHVRIPSWCKSPEVKVNGTEVDIAAGLAKGYLVLKRQWQDGDVVELELPMPVETVYSNPQVIETVGRVALQRGPIVYCLEEVDNGPNLPAVILAENPKFSTELDSELNVPVITGKAYRLQESDGELYTTQEPQNIPLNIKAVPYYIWDNRKPGEMLVWIKSIL